MNFFIQDQSFFLWAHLMRFYAKGEIFFLLVWVLVEITWNWVTIQKLTRSQFTPCNHRGIFRMLGRNFQSLHLVIIWLNGMSTWNHGLSYRTLMVDIFLNHQEICQRILKGCMKVTFIWTIFNWNSIFLFVRSKFWRFLFAVILETILSHGFLVVSWLNIPFRDLWVIQVFSNRFILDRRR